MSGAAAQIYNSGHITGFVGLTKYGDTFINQNHGVFETKLTSFFGYGNDVFVNEQGDTVLAATDPSVAESSSFVGLERFGNKGLISLQDGQVGDTFRISNSFVTLHRLCRRSTHPVQRLGSVHLGDRRLPRRARING